MKHNCPFLQYNMYCDYKRPGSSKWIVCAYKNCEKCPYYNTSKTKLKVDSKGFKMPREDIVD